MADQGMTLAAEVAALRLIARKRKQARALHDCVLYLGAIPGRERDANNVSKEAAIVDSEVAQMLANLPANDQHNRTPRSGGPG